MSNAAKRTIAQPKSVTAKPYDRHGSDLRFSIH
jgi:hypothetical protein